MDGRWPLLNINGPKQFSFQKDRFFFPWNKLFVWVRKFHKISWATICFNASGYAIVCRTQCEFYLTMVSKRTLGFGKQLMECSFVAWRRYLPSDDSSWNWTDCLATKSFKSPWKPELGPLMNMSEIKASESAFSEVKRSRVVRGQIS